MTALTGRRHSGQRKSQSDGWGQGSEITPAPGDCTVDTEEMWALWQPPEHWVHCAARPAAGHCQDWLLLPWAVSRHTAPTPTPQPNLEFQVLARKGIVSDFILLPTVSVYGGFLLIPDHPSRWSLFTSSSSSKPNPKIQNWIRNYLGKRLLALAVLQGPLAAHSFHVTRIFIKRSYHPDNLNWNIDIPILSFSYSGPSYDCMKDRARPWSSEEEIQSIELSCTRINQDWFTKTEFLMMSI